MRLNLFTIIACYAWLSLRSLASLQWLVGAENRPETRVPRNVPPRTDIKYPTFMVMTAIILKHYDQQ